MRLQQLLDLEWKMRKARERIIFSLFHKTIQSYGIIELSWLYKRFIRMDVDCYYIWTSSTSSSTDHNKTWKKVYNKHFRIYISFIYTKILKRGNQIEIQHHSIWSWSSISITNHYPNIQDEVSSFNFGNSVRVGIGINSCATFGRCR